MVDVMKIANTINTFCPYCNKHTLHVVKNVSKGKQRGLSKATRRHNRAIKGYVGSVEPKIHPKKLGKKQKVLLECKVCKKNVERTFGRRTKKKLEIKR
ncbi:MAG: 50S ribosomal protein L44e [Candidatus Marsarchaeota archaeon]|jgi:large subunit ribosomal protein L44e|nr:50S ribosomal protein L44e [Candidatus Marsarchaeota archaeon]